MGAVGQNIRVLYRENTTSRGGQRYTPIFAMYFLGH